MLEYLFKQRIYMYKYILSLILILSITTCYADFWRMDSHIIQDQMDYKPEADCEIGLVTFLGSLQDYWLRGRSLEQNILFDIEALCGPNRATKLTITNATINLCVCDRNLNVSIIFLDRNYHEIYSQYGHKRLRCKLECENDVYYGLIENIRKEDIKKIKYFLVVYQ